MVSGFPTRAVWSLFEKFLVFAFEYDLPVTPGYGFDGSKLQSVQSESTVRMLCSIGRTFRTVRSTQHLLGGSSKYLQIAYTVQFQPCKLSVNGGRPAHTVWPSAQRVPRVSNNAVVEVLCNGMAVLRLSSARETRSPQQNTLLSKKPVWRLFEAQLSSAAEAFSAAIENYNRQ